MWPKEVQVPRDEALEARDIASGGKRQQKTWYLTKEVCDRANNAVYWALAYAMKNAPDPEHVDVDRLPDSASGLVEIALWAEILRLEQMLNDGQPFPNAPAKLRTGPGTDGTRRLSAPRPDRRRRVEQEGPARAADGNASGDESSSAAGEHDLPGGSE